MGSSRGTKGQSLAALGAAGLVASLWLPWYTIQIPQAALNSAAEMAKQLGALGPLITSGTRLIGQLGPFHLTAWQTFNTTPAVLLVVGIVGGGLAVLSLTDRAGNTSQLTTLGGVVGALLVGYRIAMPPGQGSFVHPAWGIYLALVSALVMVAGGALSRNDAFAVAIPNVPGSPEWSSPPVAAAAPSGWSTVQTVAPPKSQRP